MTIKGNENYAFPDLEVDVVCDMVFIESVKRNPAIFGRFGQKKRLKEMKKI